MSITAVIHILGAPGNLGRAPTFWAGVWILGGRARPDIFWARGSLLKGILFGLITEIWVALWGRRIFYAPQNFYFPKVQCLSFQMACRTFLSDYYRKKTPLRRKTCEKKHPGEPFDMRVSNFYKVKLKKAVNELRSI